MNDNTNPGYCGNCDQPLTDGYCEECGEDVKEVFDLGDKTEYD